MSEYVVDASVAAKWFLPEEHSENAQVLLSASVVRHAPVHLPVELANVFWKKHRRGDLSMGDTRAGVARLTTLPLVLSPTAGLLAGAFELAATHRQTIYDALYLALAIRLGCPLVTADRRFYNAIAPDFPAEMRWVGDVEPPGPKAPP